jgi:DNA-binding NarL/FixJ family response regulator
MGISTAPSLTVPQESTKTEQTEKTEPHKLRLFLVDDHFYIREGLKSLITAQPDMEVIGEADNAESACRITSGCDPGRIPDIIVMDLSLPGMNGVQATERIKADCPHVRVIALSMHEDVTYLRAVLAVGASGYVIKRSARQDLVQAIRSVAVGGTYIDPSLAGKITADFVHRGGPVHSEVKGRDLSEREIAVVQLTAQGYSGKEIAARLGVSLKSVETYKTRALEKLDITTRVEIVRYAALKGWLSNS